MKAQLLSGMALALVSLGAGALPPPPKEMPPLSYQIVSVQVVGGGTEEKATVMLEQQTGRSWMLMQRGSGAPVWQALTFESGFSLNQQTIPPELGKVIERMERDEP